MCKMKVKLPPVTITCFSRCPEGAGQPDDEKSVLRLMWCRPLFCLHTSSLNYHKT